MKRRIDLAAFARLCERQIEAGVSAIVVGETAGEASTLTPAEHDSHHPRRRRDRARPRPRHCRRGIEFDQPGHRTDAARRSRRRRCGAFGGALLQQADAGRHRGAFSGDRRLTALPIILHDIPSRTVRELSDDTLARLAESRQFIGLRDATGDITRPMRLRSHAAAGVSAAVRRRRNRARLHRQWRGRLHIDWYRMSRRICARRSSRAAGRDDCSPRDICKAGWRR